MSESEHTSGNSFTISRRTLMGVALVLLLGTSFLVAHHFTSIFHESENVVELHPHHDLPPPPPLAPERHPAQVDEEREVFIVVEQMPELIGGLSSIADRIKYPEVAKKAGIEGRVFIQFIVEKDGSVSDSQIVRGIGGGCDEEAMRALADARFTPGKQRGVEVPVKMTLPVTFKL